MDSRTYVTPRTPHIHKFPKDTHNPKFTSEGRPKSQDVIPPNVKSNVAPKGKETPKTPFNQEFKRPMPKPPLAKNSPPQKVKQANGEPKPKSHAPVANATVKTKPSPQAPNTTQSIKQANASAKSTKSAQAASNQVTKQSNQTAKATSTQAPSQKTSPQTKATQNKTALFNNSNQKVAQDTQKVNPSKKPTVADDTAQKPVQKNNTKKAIEGDKAIPSKEASPKNKKPQDFQEQPDDKVSPSKIEQEMADGSKEDAVQEKRELDPLLEQVLDEELQDIMIQVWQELPDNPQDEDDRIAVDKLRNELGDDLRRVLGLNVTKRLLNVFNNLFVKIHFSCRPQMGCLTNFLKKYNIEKFKRIDKDSNVFAAEMMCIKDFDYLCASKELTCGEAKVKVTPCYKFTQCPKNLKTMYDDASYYDDKSHEPIENIKYESDELMSDDFEMESNDKKSGDVKKTDDSKIIEPEEVNIDIQESDLEDYMDIEENDLEGDEELDDEDILALMSEGVVLDECSGSDDEK